MQDFINKHQRLSIVVFSLVVIGIFIVLLIPQASPDQTVDDGRPVGEDGVGESVSLPYEIAVYSIRFSVDSDRTTDETGIEIQAFDGFHSAAVKKLYEFGMNPTDYKLNFNKENPFTRYE